MARLSSRSVLERKSAIRELKHFLNRDSHIAKLCLHYVAEHDPSFTVRNMARQAFYRIGAPPQQGSWERSFAFSE